MRILFSIVLALACPFAAAGGGTGTIGKPTSFEVNDPRQVRLLLVGVISMGKNGEAFVRAVDSQGKIVELWISERDLVPLERGTYGILTRIEDI